MSADHEAANEAEPSLWVRSDVSPDGAYIVSINHGDDVVFALDDRAAWRYAQYVLAVVARVEYDAAVIAQLKSTGLEMAAIGQVVRDLRADRAPLTSEWPISYDGIVASRTLTPQVTIAVEGEMVGQVDPAAATAHAIGVLE